MTIKFHYLNNNHKFYFYKKLLTQCLLCLLCCLFSLLISVYDLWTVLKYIQWNACTQTAYFYQSLCSIMRHNLDWHNKFSTYPSTSLSHPLMSTLLVHQNILNWRWHSDVIFITFFLLNYTVISQLN